MSLKLALLLISSLTLIQVARFSSSASNSIATTSNSHNSNNNNNLCQNVWKYPQNCQSNCTYQLVWRFKPADDSIEFIVSSKHAQRWTGVGFSQERSLANSDVIFAWIEENSRYVMMDAFLPTYATPISDKQQSISNISATVTNGRISFRFTRKRNTGDAQEDLVFSDEKCLYLIYPVEGGSVDIKNRAVITNEFVPQISEAPVCIRACNYKAPAPPASSPRPQLPFPSAARPSGRPSSSSTSPRPPITRPPTTTSTSSTTTSAPSTTTSSTTTSTTSTTTSTTTTTTPPPTTTTSSTTTTTSSTTTTPEPPSTAAPVTQAPTAPPVPPAPPAGLEPEADPQRQWCVGRWAFPSGCRFQAAAEAQAYLEQPLDGALNIRPLPLELSDCSYLAQWQYLEPTDSIEFIIQTKTRNRWTGVGFSNSTRMPNSDAIIGLIDEMSGRHFIMDSWLREHVMPEIDKEQNIESTWGKRENGTSTVRFRRRRLTGDPADFQFTDTSCAYFFFPTQGGSFNAINKRLHKHELVPSVSSGRICVRSCSRPAPEPTTSQPESSSSSQAPNLLLLAAPASPAPAPAPAPEKSLEASNVSLAPSNDLSAELDSSSTAPTSASSGQNAGRLNPFNRLAFLSEPSLRWLAGIGCVATLLAMIVFQACFTLYKNKQAYKQNLYRQSAFKQNAYLHGAYLAEHAHHQPSTGSEETQSASLHNPPPASQQPPLNRSRARQPPQVAALNRPYQVGPQVAPFAAPLRAPYDEPPSTESDEPEDEEDEELDEEEEELEDEMMERFQHVHYPHAHHPQHPPAHPQHPQYHADRHRHLHNPYHHSEQHRHHNYHAERHRTSHQQAHNPYSHSHYRPDSYFLPSQRRY